MSNPWDTPRAELGETDDVPLFVAVGRALSAWSDAEEAIAYLFAFFVEAGKIDAPAIRAYSSIIGVRNRIAMVRHAADAWFDDLGCCSSKCNPYSALKDCEGWANRRNDLAHGVVDLSLDDVPAGWFFYPGYFTKKRPFFGPSSFRYNAAQIERFAEDFSDLRERLKKVFDELREWRASPSSTTTWETY